MKRKPKKAAAGAAPKTGSGSTHTPTKKLKKKIRLLASYGFTQEEIALLTDMGESTVQRHYAHELRVGVLEADVKVIGNLFKFATSEGADGMRASIFWTKVRRRWHEVQRVIHGYDPDTIKAFVKSVVGILKRDIPDACPGCKTKLDLTPKIAQQLIQLSQEMAAKLPQSQIVPVPRPEQAGDHLDAVD